ncbi:Pentatricopeptide repeat-containing protein, mitochondrial, partial [Cucurbita argyrosperma subsp. argyrosperma]
MKSDGTMPDLFCYNTSLRCLCKHNLKKNPSGLVPEALNVMMEMRSYMIAPNSQSVVMYCCHVWGTGLWTTWLIPDRKFYFDLIGILCGAERASYALELFEKMKRSSLGGYSPVYDVLIPKLCRGGDFEMGRQLWEEAMAMGLKLGCSVRFSSQQERFIAKFLRNTTEAEKQNEAATDKTIAMGKRRDEVEERAVG